MVYEFLIKYRSELLSQKDNVSREIDSLQLQVLENKKFLDILNNNNDSVVSVFTPRQSNIKNTQKISELEFQLNELKQSIDIKTELLNALESRINELNSVLNSNEIIKSNSNVDADFIITKLSDIKSFVFVDPQRTINEIDALISSISSQKN